MFQVMPKLLAGQAFAFGTFGSKLGYPDAILVFLFCFPIASAVWKTLMVAMCLYLSSYELSWFKIKNLFLSPFICTRIERTQNDVINQSNELLPLHLHKKLFSISSILLQQPTLPTHVLLL